jgi:hypothetical protein
MDANNTFFLVPGSTREFNAIQQWAYTPEFQLKLFFFKLSLDLNKVSLKNKKGLQDLWEIWKPAKENGNPFSTKAEQR